MLEMIKFYTLRGLKIERAEGQYLWDTRGEKYLDCHTEHGAAPAHGMVNLGVGVVEEHHTIQRGGGQC